MKKLIGCMVLAVAACGGSKTAPKTETAQTQNAAASTLTISELKFYEGDEVGLKLHADGKFEAKATHSTQGKPPVEEWHQIGELAADGTISHDGKVMGQLQADGTLKMTDGSVAPFKIDGETLVAGEQKITIGDKGVFQGTNPQMRPMRVDGITDAGSKRTALLLLAIIAGASKASAPPPAAVKP